MTPKLKYLIFLNGIKYMIMFFKISATVFNTFRFHQSSVNHLILFYKYFYTSRLVKLPHFINLRLVGGYTNNLKKSIVFSSMSILNTYLKNNFYPKFYVKLEKYILFNSYFLAIKLANTFIIKKFYQSVFVYLLLFLPHLWFGQPTYLKFYLNFIFVNHSLQMYKFYNGRFFKVYNF